ncbi:MAG: glycosyltransferase family 4 protein, partial [bacterium]|nr:glycosyltransferase family 4 protein [bacterium]
RITLMAKPTIFACTTAYHPFIGGAEIAIQEVARRLAGEFRFFILTARMRRDLPPREARPEGTIIRIGFGTSFDKWLLPLALPFVFFRERGGVRGALWGMDVSTGALAAAFTSLLSPRTPFVFTIQYGYGGGRLRHGRFGAIGKAFGWMLGCADAVTAISNYLREEAACFGYRRSVTLLPNGVPLEAFFRVRAPAKPDGPPVIITTSRLVPKNGVDILIRAVVEMRKAVPEVRCHILGSGPERARLEELARTLGVAPAIKFFGDVPYGDVPRHLAMADVFVRPARSEGMGNAFIEALAAGLPIVGTPVEGILDIIEDGKTGLFAKVDDPADVAEKTLRLLRDPGLCRRIADAGGAMVRERFSWDGIASGYAGVFRRALLPNILIATPMLPPDIGGPGAYARRLAEEFIRRGCRVSLLSYGSKGVRGIPGAVREIRIPLGAPALARMLRFGVVAWLMLRQSDIAIALDPVGVGWPLAIACRMRGKPFIIRVEGDALWERYVERTGEELTLKRFYEMVSNLILNSRERARCRMSRRVFPRARRIVFSSRWREAIFASGNPLRPDQTALIASPFPRPGGGTAKREPVFVFAGRLVRVKNISRLIRAFLSAAGPGYRLELVGDGPERPEIEKEIRRADASSRISVVGSLPADALLKRIARARALVLPSFSDVSPNIILECMAAGTPFLLTRETGFYETLKGAGVFVDPLNENDIAGKLHILMDGEAYTAERERLLKFNGARSWEAVAGEWLNLIQASL